MIKLTGIEKALEKYGIQYCEIKFTEMQSIVFKKHSDGYTVDCTDNRLLYVAHSKESEIVKVIEEIVEVIGVDVVQGSSIFTKITVNSEPIVEYSGKCLVFWMNCIDYIHYMYAKSLLRGWKDE